jgi:hypothetical protein
MLSGALWRGHLTKMNNCQIRLRALSQSGHTTGDTTDAHQAGGGKMAVSIDLTLAGGSASFGCHGTIQSQRLGGRRLLLLFGERHSLKPFIRDTLLNVIELDKLGLLSCVGVEGHPGKDIPGWETQRRFESLQRESGGDNEKMVEGMLRAFIGRDFYFWKTLVLMRPNLKVQSVDDGELCDRASVLEGLWCNQRHDHIRERLRQSDLFQVAGVESSPPERDRQIDVKVAVQFEQEWSEHEVNVTRDRKMLDNLMALWNQSGPEKIAVLNAGSSHQWRLARLLPAEISFYHIEQP